MSFTTAPPPADPPPQGSASAPGRVNPARPLVGVTLDAEPAGGWSAFPWHALRANYLEAVAASGGLPVALGHDPALADATLDLLDALVVTGGAFDVDPALYGDPTRHRTVSLKETRTATELALIRGALDRGLPVLGICGGMQLLAVALGGTLIQHIPDAIADAIPHEQTNPRDEPGHEIALIPGSRLAAIAATPTMSVNSAHHQAVLDPGRARACAHAADGVVEAIELPGHTFCIGVQWHPEFLIDPGDARLFDALVEAARA